MKGIKRNVLVDAYYADGKPAIAMTGDKTVYQRRDGSLFCIERGKRVNIRNENGKLIIKIVGGVVQ